VIFGSILSTAFEGILLISHISNIEIHVSLKYMVYPYRSYSLGNKLSSIATSAFAQLLLK